MNEKIKEIIKAYHSIIDLEESKEVMHLIADLDTLFKEELDSLPDDCPYFDDCSQVAFENYEPTHNEGYD